MVWDFQNHELFMKDAGPTVLPKKSFGLLAQSLGFKKPQLNGPH